MYVCTMYMTERLFYNPRLKYFSYGAAASPFLSVSIQIGVKYLAFKLFTIS